MSGATQRGELLTLGENAVDVSALLAVARDRFGQPSVVWCDRWRIGELLDAHEGRWYAPRPGGRSGDGLEGWRR